MKKLVDCRTYTKEELTSALELLEEFLEAMPELSIDPKYTEEFEIATSSFGGDHHAYILASFGSFLYNCAYCKQD